MGLLDKLKPQPRWRHADASVRLDALKELDDLSEIVSLAETDPDARVRRAAVGRVPDAGTLSRIAASDLDASVRERAVEGLLALATSPEDEASAMTAVRGLTDPRHLSTVAKSAAPEAVALEAVTRLDEPRALGAIARHAKHEAAAVAAAARVTDATELLDVVLHGEHRDVALAAFDRLLPDPGPDALELLSTIETRAQQKAVSRRARAAIQSVQEAETARQKAVDERRRREAALCEDVERLAAVTDAGAIESELARLTGAWTALEVTDEASRGRFDAAVAGARETIARLAREAEAAVERERQRAEAIATRDALCARVETLDGDDVLEQLIPIEEEWRSLLPLVGNGPEADRLAERFAAAVAACRKRHEMGTQLAATRDALAALVAEAETLPTLTDAAAASDRWLQISREARGLAATLAAASRPAGDLAARWKVVEEAFMARELGSREAELQAQKDVAALLQRLVERAKRVADAETITLREGERLMRDMKAALDELVKVPATPETEDLVAALDAHQEKIAPRVRELREMDEWRRFANAQRQEQLIAMAEAIVTSLKADDEAGKEPDLAATSRALREMHTQWREVAEAPRHSAQRLWERFSSATGFIRTRCEPYFARLRDERVQNLQKRAAIVEEAEALAQSNDWGKAAARFQELQNEWQATGGSPKDAGRELGQRFRAACNTFFARRREDLVTRKKVWTDNMARKEALCERAEALAESTEWESAAAEMKRLQADWKTIGPVRRNKSEAIWARFRAAADTFFERYHNRHAIAAAGKVAEREAIVVELEAIAAIDQPDPPADLADQLQAIRQKWTKGGPLPGVDLRPLQDRWQAALSTIGQRWPVSVKGTEFDPDVVRQRLEKLVSRIEGLAGQVEEPKIEARSQAELLAAKLRSALASNAMGGRSNDESRWRAAAESVKEAQAAWQRLSPLAGDAAQHLAPRFREACRKVTEHTRRHSGPPPRRSPRTPSAAAV
jgi:hypothetical protein